ncbi:MAG: hypothetical protein ACREVV_06760, partial [Steroidobacteraceae bacterium]
MRTNLGILRFSACGLALACATAVSAAASPTPTALTHADIAAKVIAALGGAHRMRALKSLRATGTMEGVSGFPGSYTMEASAPDSRRVTWDIHYLQQTTSI